MVFRDLDEELIDSLGYRSVWDDVADHAYSSALRWDAQHKEHERLSTIRRDRLMYERRPVLRKCELCGSEYYTTNSQARHGRRKRCDDCRGFPKLIDGLSRSVYLYRLEKGWDKRRAATTPPRARKQPATLPQWVAELAERNGVPRNRLRKRLLHGWGNIEAATVPVLNRQK